MRLTSFSTLFWLASGLILLAVAFPALLQPFMRISTGLYERYGGSPEEVDRIQYPASDGKPEGVPGLLDPADLPGDFVALYGPEKTVKLITEEKFASRIYADDNDLLTFKIVFQYNNPSSSRQEVNLIDEIENGFLGYPSYTYRGDKPEVIIPRNFPEDNQIVIQVPARSQGEIEFLMGGGVRGQAGERLINKAILTQPSRSHPLEDEATVLIRS